MKYFLSLKEICYEIFVEVEIRFSQMCVKFLLQQTSSYTIGWAEKIQKVLRASAGRKMYLSYSLFKKIIKLYF